MNHTPEELVPVIAHFAQPTYTIGVEAGWWPLVRRCHDELVVAVPDYVLTAVKQKWGELEIQATSPRHSEDYDVIIEITERYADESGRICEYCGEPGRLRTGRWLEETLCDACDKAAG